MKVKLRYLYWGYLPIFSLLVGFVIFDYIRFLRFFFDANTFDGSVLILLLLASGFLSQKYLKIKENIAFIIQILLLVVLMMADQVKEVVLLFPDFLSVLIYVCFVLFGLTMAVAVRISEAQKKALSIGIVMLSVGVGMGLGFSFDGKEWFRPLLLIAIVLNLALSPEVNKKLKFTSTALLVLAFAYSGFSTTAFEYLPSQKKYHDKLTFSHETPFQKIDVTSWKGNQWFYFNGINQFSTLDEWMYYEPMVHPVMQMSKAVENILVIGGENGLIARELGKYNKVHRINILPIDTAFYGLGKRNPIFTSINQGALSNEKIVRIEGNVFRFLNKLKDHYDVIFMDVPDPIDLELNQYYTREFYQLCHQALKNEALMIAQSGSPYYATKAFYAISKTIESVGFNILPLHNQVMTLGEWGWVIGSKTLSAAQLKERCSQLEFDDIETRWINNEAMRMMMSFGKPYMITDSIEINSLKNPVIHQYYSVGTWNFD